MRYYPVFLDLEGEKVVFSGAGEHAAAKIRLLMKTSALIDVYGSKPCEDVREWSLQGKLELHTRKVEADDVAGARLVYGANDDPQEDARAVELGKKAGALTNIVDNLEASEFLTPAIVDRDPVTVAIGTEGTAPVLARKIKSGVEEMLPQSTGILARIGDGFRKKAALLGDARIRRQFWKEFFFTEGPKAFSLGGQEAAEKSLEQLHEKLGSSNAPKGHVDLVGTGPGDPELLTLKARKKLHDADVVLHDRLVTPQILELARREAVVICVGKKGFGKSWKQEDINALMVEHARQGHKIARLKSGDPVIFGRLDEEIDALEKEGISWEVIPGITSASAASATIGTSLTRRGRNSSLRYLTGHDMDGFAPHDWKELARSGATSAVYMGVRASKFFSGRLLMHGASPQTPVTIVENASRIDQKVLESTLEAMAADMQAAGIKGPAILFVGLAPRRIGNQLLVSAKSQLKSA